MQVPTRRCMHPEFDQSRRNATARPPGLPHRLSNGARMKNVRNAIACALLPLVCGVGAVHAQGQGIGHNGSYGPPWDTGITMSMDRLTPEQQDRVIQIKTKMMQMEMDHQEAMTKMEMQFEQTMMPLRKQLLEVFR